MITLCFLLCWLLPMTALALAQPDPEVGRMVDKIVREEGKLHKEMAIEMGIDPARWSRAIHGLESFDARWMLRLPDEIFFKLVRRMTTARLDRWMVDARAEAQEARR